MANLSINVAQVIASTGNLSPITFGATMTQGQPYYLDASDSGYAKPAQSNTNAVQAEVIGITQVAGARGQTGFGVTKDPNLNIGAPLTEGTMYVVSNTPGDICPSSDLSSGNYVTFLGTANAAGNLNLNPTIGGVHA